MREFEHQYAIARSAVLDRDPVLAPSTAITVLANTAAIHKLYANFLHFVRMQVHHHRLVVLRVQLDAYQCYAQCDVHVLDLDGAVGLQMRIDGRG